MALSVSLLAGCGGEGQPPSPDRSAGPDRPPGSGESSGPEAVTASVRVVAEDEAQLHLWVSNQSFLDDPARITVRIDGIEVVDRDFLVEGQHSWSLFPLALPAGEHDLRVVAADGTTLSERFRTRAGATRYAVADYFHYAGGRPQVSWRIQDEPVAFD